MMIPKMVKTVNCCWCWLTYLAILRMIMTCFTKWNGYSEWFRSFLLHHFCIIYFKIGWCILILMTVDNCYLLQLIPSLLAITSERLIYSGSCHNCCLSTCYDVSKDRLPWTHFLKEVTNMAGLVDSPWQPFPCRHNDVRQQMLCARAVLEALWCKMSWDVLQLWSIT